MVWDPRAVYIMSITRMNVKWCLRTSNQHLSMITTRVYTRKACMLMPQDERLYNYEVYCLNEQVATGTIATDTYEKVKWDDPSFREGHSMHSTKVRLSVAYKFDSVAGIVILIGFCRGSLGYRHRRTIDETWWKINMHTLRLSLEINFASCLFSLFIFEMYACM